METNHSSSFSFSLKTVPEAIVEHLRQLIVNGDLKPGQRLVQDELAESLGVSRTPVREALNRLAHEGWVTISKYKGAIVTEFSPNDLEEIYTVRCALESYAVSLAAETITENELDQLASYLADMSTAFQTQQFEKLLEAHQLFHMAIYKVSGKQRMIELIGNYMDQSMAYQRIALGFGRGASDPISEHSRIYQALKQHDVNEANHQMQVHLRLTAKEIKELVSSK